jgi:hypothetical protein
MRARNLEFSLDHCFGTDAEQEDVYKVVGKGLVARVIDGFNAAILAYGQTGSGKTFTMLGPDDAKASFDLSNTALGIVPRACMQLFEGLPAGCKVSLSYMEVYNDSVNDLLDTTGTKYMPLRETSPGHIEPDGLTLVPVKDTREVLSTIVEGDKKRIVAAMAMNPRSSRGHGLIGIVVTKEDGSPHGRLMLVDLAGMESSKKSSSTDAKGESAKKERQREAKAINQSLLALSDVISALASKAAMHIPYRNSKLTRLLRSSLAGNCKAAFVVTCRSEKQNIEEAIVTLRFAQRAKSVEAKVVKNEDLKKPGGNKKLEAELDSAKQSLASFESKLAESDVQKVKLMAEVQTLLAEMQTLQRDADASKRQRITSDAGKGPQYIAQLEARVEALEEENRLLRQRDIMHRLVKLDEGEEGAAAGSGAAESPGLKLQFSAANLETFQPFTLDKQQVNTGFATQLQRSMTDREMIQKQIQVERARSRAQATSSKWNPLSVAFRFMKLRSPKVTPSDARYSAQPPPPKPLQPGLTGLRANTAAARAATHIQAVWRGRMTRDELYWEMMGY